MWIEVLSFWKAEIDAACELIDFFTFNVQSALELEQSQDRFLSFWLVKKGIWFVSHSNENLSKPLSPDVGITNKIHYRAREGFVAAISPFNFTAIGGNLAGTPGTVSVT